MSEHDEQCALFAFAAWAAGRVPELSLLHAIPNGGARHPAVAAKLKAEGVKAGIPDVFLPVARGGRNGLYVELKYGKNKTSAEQDRWIDALREQGYAVAVCYGWQEAARKLLGYLRADPQEFGL